MTAFDPNTTIAFVTGTNKQRGIGRAIVDALAAAGVPKIYATARKPEQLQDLLAAHGDRIVPVALDVTDTESIRAAVAKAQDVTLLINNSGTLADADALRDPDGARREMDVNYFGPLNLTREFAPALQRNHGSVVVNLLSLASHINFALGATYSASKAAAHSLTTAQRREFAASGTRVIGVYPGPIDTELAEEVPMDKAAPSLVADAILTALRDGAEDVFPDPMAQGLFAQWREDPKAVEQMMADMAAEA